MADGASGAEKCTEWNDWHRSVCHTWLADSLTDRSCYRKKPENCLNLTFSHLKILDPLITWATNIPVNELVLRHSPEAQPQIQYYDLIESPNRLTQVDRICHLWDAVYPDYPHTGCTWRKCTKFTKPTKRPSYRQKICSPGVWLICDIKTENSMWLSSILQWFPLQDSLLSSVFRSFLVFNDYIFMSCTYVCNTSWTEWHSTCAHLKTNTLSLEFQ